MAKRTAIPASIQRQLLFESGSRCAACGAVGPLEFAHIRPWSKTRKHDPARMLVLCAGCHGMADRHDWSEKLLQMYKNTPWIMRDHRQARTSTRLGAQAGMTVLMDLDHFSQKGRKAA